MVEIGQVIEGKYRVDRLVGKGGMGSVFAGTHLHIGRRVALKVLHVSGESDVAVVKRFEREAQAAARIGNDHILDVIDFGTLPDGSRYMVCEFLEGETLAARMERERQLSPAELVPITRQLLNGLSAAHAAGVVHRDLKPDNIFLLAHKAGWADFVKIIDFGISKFQAIAGADNNGLRMTATGVVMGTPYYLSPEQARGTNEADQRSDVYSVGVILYEAATGRVPFDAANFNDLIFKIVLEDAPLAHVVNPNIEPGFSQIIRKAMDRDPNRRFQSAAQFVDELERWATSVGLSLSGPVVTSDARRRMTSSESLPPSPPRLRTPASWGGTQPEHATSFNVKPRRTALITSLSVLGLLLCAGVVYGLHSALGGRTKEGIASSSQPSAAGPQAPSAAQPVVSPALSPAVPLPSDPPLLGNPQRDFEAPAEREPALPSMKPARPQLQYARPQARPPSAPQRAVPAESQSAAQAPEKPPKRIDVLGY